jgi:hypothetical protein
MGLPSTHYFYGTRDEQILGPIHGRETDITFEYVYTCIYSRIQLAPILF